MLPQRKVGDLVNLEVDVLAKYAQSSMQQLTARIEQLEVSATAQQSTQPNKAHSPQSPST